MRAISIGIFLLLVAISARLNAADLTVRVFGQASDAQHNAAVISGATVCYASIITGVTDRKITDSSGTVIFSNVPLGNLTLVTNANLFVGKSLSFSVNGNQFQNVTLTPSTSPTTPIACPTSPRLEVTSIKINNGDASTTIRSLRVNFTTTPPAKVPQFYRIAEFQTTLFKTPNALDVLSALNAQSFQSLSPGQTQVIFNLPAKDPSGVRYGIRSVGFQVKFASEISPHVTESIRLDPGLKQYTAPADSVFRFAATHGYSVEKTDSVSPSLSTCTQICVGGTIRNDVQCSETHTRRFFSTSLKKFWSIEGVNAPEWRFSKISSSLVNLTLTHDYPFAAVEPDKATCFPRLILTEPDAIVFLGPEVDDFIDSANPWKNAFAP